MCVSGFWQLLYGKQKTTGPGLFVTDPAKPSGVPVRCAKAFLEFQQTNASLWTEKCDRMFQDVL